MKRVLYAWEMGAGLGHVAAFLPVAEALRDAGCEVACAVRDTATAAEVLASRRIPWLQAPFLHETPSAAPLLTYTDIMLRHGFAEPGRLLGHVGAWRSVFELFRPDVVIADHSPSALFAARLAGLPTMLYGTGFCCPPAGVPMPAMRPWETPPPELLWRSEQTAVTTMRQVAAAFGQRAPDKVGALFDADESTILGFPELDHYPQRSAIDPAARYWGVIGNAGFGARPQWPNTPGRRLFVYVRPAYPHLALLLRALGELRQPTILYCPGIEAAQLAALRAQPHIGIAETPLDLALVFEQADAAVTNGSFFSSTGFLQAGKPVLVLPTHLEQFLVGWRVEQSGCGLFVAGDQAPTDLLVRLHRILNDPAIRRDCEAFAARYRQFDQAKVVDNIAQRVIALSGGAA